MRLSAVRTTLGAGIVAAVAALGAPAQAITINDPYGDNASIALGSPFTAVVDIVRGTQFCTGTLIAADTVLTAQHCVRSSSTNLQFDLGGYSILVKDATGATVETRTVGAVFEMDTNASNLLDGTDVAIMKLDTGVAGGNAAPMHVYLGNPSDLVGQMATLVGFGNNGLGSTGTTGPANNDNKRRAATNQIDSYGSPRTDACAAVAGSNIFSTDFDNGEAANNTLAPAPCNSTQTTINQVPPTATNNPTEGSTARGDSGGPLLYLDPSLDEYLIAGVLTDGITPLGNESGYSDISRWTSIGSEAVFAFLEPFLAVAAPAPETLALFALMVAGMALYRRRAFIR
jgi:hypothetical protein